jgi:hypothetical protein
LVVFFVRVKRALGKVMTDHKVQMMADDRKQETEPTEPKVVEIRIRGHLDGQWTDWFGGLTITLEENGDTLLTGPIIDQAALFGLLRRVRDLGMQLISVNRVGTRRPGTSTGES